MKLPITGSHDEGKHESAPCLLGPPFALAQERCAGLVGAHLVALLPLLSLAVHACAIGMPSSESLWKALLQQPSKKPMTSTGGVTLKPLLLALLLAVGRSAA